MQTTYYQRVVKWIPPLPVFCNGKDGARREITYFDILKDFRFMADKGFDYQYIYGISGRTDVLSGRNF